MRHIRLIDQLLIAAHPTMDLYHKVKVTFIMTCSVHVRPRTISCGEIVLDCMGLTEAKGNG